MEFEQLVTSISCRRGTRATRCFTRIVLCAEVDGQCDELNVDLCKCFNLVRPFLSNKLTTRCDDRRAAANYFLRVNAEYRTKLQSAIILEVT